jgi:hypothetical protein
MSEGGEIPSQEQNFKAPRKEPEGPKAPPLPPFQRFVLEQYAGTKVAPHVWPLSPERAAEMNERVTEGIEKIPDYQDRVILRSYYGLDNTPQQTMTDIAKNTGLTSNQIRHRLARARATFYQQNPDIGGYLPMGEHSVATEMVGLENYLEGDLRRMLGQIDIYELPELRDQIEVLRGDARLRSVAAFLLEDASRYQSLSLYQRTVLVERVKFMIHRAETAEKFRATEPVINDALGSTNNPEQVAAMPIESFGFSPRTRDALLRAGIKDGAGLFGKTRSDLRKLGRLFGEKTIDEIESKIKEVSSPQNDEQ